MIEAAWPLCRMGEHGRYSYCSWGTSILRFLTLSHVSIFPKVLAGMEKIPVEWEFELPFGVVYSQKPSKSFKRS